MVVLVSYFQIVWSMLQNTVDRLEPMNGTELFAPV